VRFLGLSSFFSQQIRQPDPDVLQMFSALSSQIGLFTERKRAEEELKRRPKRKRKALTGEKSIPGQYQP